MKLKKLILGFTLVVLGLFVQAQTSYTGLQNIIVEKYYVATAADVAANTSTQQFSTNPLVVGAVTYRVYADMLPGYKFSALYGQSVVGVPKNPLKITTTTKFFNNIDRGDITPTYTKAQAALNTVMLDSWLSVGAGCAGGNFAIPIAEDNGLNTVTHPAGVLTALNANDGLLAGTTQAVSFVGPQVDAGTLVFGNVEADQGGSFIVNDGSIGSLNGAPGAFPSGTNRVCLGQFTTDGVFHIELNLQILSPTGVAENFVVSNPVGAEDTKAFLVQTFYPTPQPPTVNLTAPANNANFTPLAPITFKATAGDVDGTIASVEFFQGTTSLGFGILSSGVYSLTLSGGLADNVNPYSITAKATDNDGLFTISAPILINVGNAAPIFDSFTKTTAIPNGVNYVVGDAVSFAATAHDIDGNVISLQLFDGATPIGAPVTGTTTSLSGTFNVASLALGTHTFTVKATDNGAPGKVTTSSSIVLVVSANVLPVVAIGAPIAGAVVDVALDLSLSATATDADGTVTSVEFFKGTTSLGVGSKVGNVFSATVPAASLVVGPMSITAVATDNKGGVKTSDPVNVTVKNNSVDYEIAGVRQECYVGSACMKINAVKAVTGVIGYNFTIAYDKDLVVPTGVTVSPALLGAVPTTYVKADTYIDAAAGTIAVSIYFTGGPVTAAFNGTGEICCVQFDQLPAFTGDASTTLSFTSPGVTESYPTYVSDVDGQAGTFEIFRDWFLYSNLKNWSDNQAIKYDPLNTAAYLVTNILGQSPQGGAAGAAVQPDLNGTFKYDIRNGLKIDIQRDILPATDVISVIEGNDAFLTSKVSLGVPISNYVPAIYNIIAMDVNRDTRITAGDATQINRRSVGLLTEFAQVSTTENKDWLFVAKTVADNDPHYKISTTYPQDNGIGFSRARVPYISKFQDVKYNTDYNTCPDLRTSEDYLGVLLGDADESYELIAHDGVLKSAEAGTTSEIVIDLTKATIVNGNIQLPVSLNCAEAVNSYSFKLGLNANVKVNSVNTVGNDNLAYNYKAAENALLVSTYISGNTTIATDKTVANILVDGSITSLSINDLTGVTSKINGNDAKVVVIDATTGISERTKDVDVQVYPNPASDRLNIEVSKDSKVQIMDISGKRIGDSRNVNANQKEVIDVTNLAPGVYMVKVYNEKSVVVKKVVIKK